MKKKPGKVDTVSVPHIEMRAAMRSESAGETERVVEATFYTGAEVVRMPMFDDPYLLSFSMDPKSVRMGRLNSGAPVLDSHDKFGGVNSVLGVVESGKIEDGHGVATLRFSNRTELDSMWSDVQDGILRNLSMGVQIFELTELGEDEATGMPRVQATDWEPQEISLLAVGADPGARIQLADEGGGAPCRVIHRAEAAADAHHKGTTMNIKVRLLADGETGKAGEIIEILENDFNETLHSKTLEVVKAPKVSVDAATMSRELDEKLAADTEYAKQIKRVASHYNLDDLWAQRQINLGVTSAEAIASATAERSKLSPVGPNHIGFGNDFEAAEWKLGTMADALTARGMRKEPGEAARQYAGWSFADCAIECLSLRGKARGLDARRDASRIFSTELALHSTSDFPLLLANVLNKIMLPAYENANPTYRDLASQETFNDFRPHNFLAAGDFPVPMKVNEHGEFKYGSMGENNEPVTAATYGRILGLSRQTLVNDDMNAFGNLAGKAAMRVADFENATFFATCFAPNSGLGPDLADGNPVFDAAHGNVGSAGALTVTLLGEARALMMKQTSLDGLKLNTPAEILLVSPDSLTLAEQLTAPLSQLIGQGASAAPVPNVNPFAGKLRPVADANLAGTRFYVLASPGRMANFVYGYLGGVAGPRTEVRQGFEVDGVEFKLALDFGVGAVESRGGTTGAGA